MNLNRPKSQIRNVSSVSLSLNFDKFKADNTIPQCNSNREISFCLLFIYSFFFRGRKCILLVYKIKKKCWFFAAYRDAQKSDNYDVSIGTCMCAIVWRRTNADESDRFRTCVVTYSKAHTTYTIAAATSVCHMHVTLERAHSRRARIVCHCESTKLSKPTNRSRNRVLE